ncbi:MAG: hypothetical protein WCO25_06040 [Candidatus Uhrbacteria bacterium]
MIPAPKPLITVIYVVIESLDEPNRPVETVQMFWPGAGSDFERAGLSFRWRAKQLSVLRIGSGLCQHVFHNYDEQYLAHGEHNRRVLVTTKATLLDATAYEESLGPPTA